MAVTATAAAAAECVVGPEPEKSELDDRSYRTLTLANGLKVLLVSDPALDKAAAALDVAVGFFSDPESLPGLAHFLEHMLFLGTAKYPDEESYSAYLAEKGGDSNAYTSCENTNYQFQVIVPKSARDVDVTAAAAAAATSPSPLYEALDRFSQFFIAPLFTEAATTRELNAVDSEHQKNVQNDGQRLFQLTQSCANRQHPFSKFGTGSKATLWDVPNESGVDTRAALLDFHRKYYSANLMRLCITSPHALSVMQKWAVELFTPIANTNAPLPAIEYAQSQPLTQAEMRRVLHVVPIKDVRQLALSWLVPSLQSGYRSKPASFISHLLGHEGKGSLLSLLKGRGWVDALAAGQSLSAHDFAFFDVSINLTKAGVDRVDEIAQLVFGFVRLILESGVERWIHDESAALADMSFRFAERVEPFSLVQRLSSQMSLYPEQEYLSGAYLIKEYDPERVRSLLECLTPDRVNLMVVGSFVEGSTDASEKWYGTAYRCETIPDEKLSAWRSAAPDASLAIPARNPFIPTNFSLAAEPVPAGEADDAGPVLIIDTDKFEVHHKLDRTFRRPKVDVRIMLLTPLAYSSPRNHVLSNIFVSLLADELTEYSYDADLAGLSYSLRCVEQGVQLAVSGYSDRLQVLLGAILDKMATFRANPERFAMIYDQWERQWANFDKDQPYQHAMYGVLYLLETPRWHVHQYLACLRGAKDVTVDAVDAFVPQLLGRLRAVCLVHGNVTGEWTRKMCAGVDKALAFDALPAVERPCRRVVQLPTDCAVVTRKVGANTEDQNSAVHVSFQVGPRGNFRTDVLLELLAEVMNKPAFHELRTKQQLGYMVFTGVDKTENVLGLFVIIQSTVADPDELCRRIEAFLRQFRTETLEAMSAAEFEGFVDSTIATKLEKDKRMAQRSHRFYTEITGRTYLYHRAEREIEALRQVRKEDVASFFDKHIGADAPARRKVSSLVFGSTHPMADSKVVAQAAVGGESAVPARVVSDPVAFRLSYPLYPAPGRHDAFVQVEPAFTPTV
jgi:insulysin